jgi:hypothetical protein
MLRIYPNIPAEGRKKIKKYVYQLEEEDRLFRWIPLYKKITGYLGYITSVTDSYKAKILA